MRTYGTMQDKFTPRLGGKEGKRGIAKFHCVLMCFFLLLAGRALAVAFRKPLPVRPPGEECTAVSPTLFDECRSLLRDIGRGCLIERSTRVCNLSGSCAEELIASAIARAVTKWGCQRMDAEAVKQGMFPALMVEQIEHTCRSPMFY
jgi:hypothetical protein